MSKLLGRIPASQIVEGKGWHLPTLESDDQAKVFVLTGNNGKSVSTVRSGKKSSSKPSGSARKRPSSKGIYRKARNVKVNDNTKEQNDLEGQPQAHQQEQLQGHQEEPVQSSQEEQVQDHQEEQVQSNQEEQAEIEDPAIDDLEEPAPSIKDEDYLRGETLGFEAGEKAGREKGEAEAKAEFELAFNEEIKEKRDVMASLIKAAEESLGDIDQIEKSLVALITKVTQTVILSEFKLHPDLINPLVTNALKALPHGVNKVKIRVNPQHLDFLESEYQSQTIEYIPDNSLSIGGCLIDSEFSSIDASLGLRIKEALQNVFSNQSQDDSEFEEEKLIALSEEIKPDVIKPDEIKPEC